MSKIRIITIDFWNTLYDSSNGDERNAERNAVIAHSCQRLGYDVSAEKINDTDKRVRNYYKLIWEEEQRTPTSDELVQAFWSFLDLTPDNRAVKDLLYIFSESVLRHPPKLLPNAYEVLSRLSTQYRLGLISDTAFSPGNVLRKLMQQDKVAKLFSQFSFSDETGAAKPHEQAFRPVLEAFAAHPSEAIHVGDLERTDIIGAKLIGMKAIRFIGNFNPEVHPEQMSYATIADRTAETWLEIEQCIKELS
jgi:FMN phosphatase YigB (HAD superfamily)